MQSDQPSTNGDAHAEVNPTPPEDKVSQGDSIVKPTDDASTLATNTENVASNSQIANSEPAEHVESGISGVAAFLPPDSNVDQPTPSPSEPLGSGAVELQDETMTDAPGVAAVPDTSALSDQPATEPVQQHTPAPEVTEPATNGVTAAEESVGAEQAATSTDVALKSEAATSPETSAPIATASAQSPALPGNDQAAIKSSPDPVDVQMSESTSSLTRPREEDEPSDERSAKRARLDESAVESTPVATPVAEEFKRPEAPVTGSAPGTAPAPATSAPSAPTTNGTATGHLPPRSTYTTEPLTKLQKKQLEEKIKNTKKVKSAFAFLRPVDYMALNIPHYPNVIKQPMDLSTMEQKLKTDQYSSLEAFVSDFELMVNNCFTFNGPAHAVSSNAQTLRAYFLKQMDSVPTGDAAVSAPKPKKQSPVPKSIPRRESRVSAGPTAPVASAPAPVSVPTAQAPTPGSARSPGANDTFALLPGGTPQIRRDSSAGRPKRAVIPPASRDLPYTGSKPKRKENQVGLKFCQFVLDELRKPRYDHMTVYFREPVDPVALNIPHYFQVIKRPMDMQTITSKLKNGQYGSADEFKADFDQMFSNCFKFNPPDNGVHQTGKTLQGEFEALWSQKNSWVKKHQPRSQRVSPASDNESDAQESSEEEDEAEDEKEATIRALKEQLESMQNMLGAISGAKRDSPKASGKKKSRSSTGGTKSKKSSVSAAPAKSAAKAKAPKKPRLVTYEEKQEISNATENMDESQINTLTTIITESVSKYKVSFLYCTILVSSH